MNIEHFETLLRDKEREIQDNLRELESEARASGESEVREPIDDATASQGMSESFEEGALVSRRPSKCVTRCTVLERGPTVNALCVDARLSARGSKLFHERRTAWRIRRSRTASRLITEACRL